MMVTRTRHYVPIDECIDSVHSLIEEVFGERFYFKDESGRALTTVRNQRLLSYAKELAAKATAQRHSKCEGELSRLGRLADVLTAPDEYQALAADTYLPFWEFDHAAFAGALE